MKIAFIHISKGIVNRGSEASTDYLANYLARKHKVSFFQAGGLCKNKRFQQIQIKLPFRIDSHKTRFILGKILERLYLDFNNLKILYFSLKVLPYLLKEEFDILIPTNGFWQVLACKLVKLLRESKIVIFGRAGIGFHDQGNLRLKPDLFIALTRHGEKWVQKINSKVKTAYVPNAIDYYFYFSNKKPLFKNSLPIILTVAALTQYKRIDLVIKAVAKMKKKCFLIIAGQGELKDELSSLAKKQLGNNFIIKNFSSEEMPGLYNSCQVFTLVSESQDAFPRVLLEAMACGANLVVRDDPVKKEVVQKAGFFVDPENIALYSRTLERALKENKGSLATKRAQDFEINKIGLKLEKRLLSLLKA